MRFSDLLRTTVLTCTCAATVLAVVAVVGFNNNDEVLHGLVAVAWWVLASLIGTYLGRRRGTSRQIAVLLASARTQPTLPEINPGRTVLNRLWPILVYTIGAGAVAFAYPQVPAIAAGFAIIWAFAWRHQAAAVMAIEERDGARFYVERTAPFQQIKLVRTPGFRSNVMQLGNVRRGSPVAGRHS